MKYDFTEENRLYNRKDLYSKYRVVTTGLSLAVFIALSMYIVYLFFNKYHPFSWHPAFMTLGFVLLMSDAILAISPDNIILFFFPRLKNSSKLQHALLQGLGLICILVAFIVAVVYKNSHGFNHFVSYHAIIGLVAVIGTFLTCAGGLFTYYAVKLKDFVKPSYNKIGHAIIGILTFALGIVAEGTGIFTKPFQFRSNSEVQIACTVLMSLASLIVLEGAMKSTYSRFQRIL